MRVTPKNNKVMYRRTLRNKNLRNVVNRMNLSKGYPKNNKVMYRRTHRNVVNRKNLSKGYP